MDDTQVDSCKHTRCVMPGPDVVQAATEGASTDPARQVGSASRLRACHAIPRTEIAHRDARGSREALATHGQSAMCLCVSLQPSKS